MRLKSPHSKRRGLTMIVALVCLIIMGMTMFANSKATFHLQRELRELDRQQQAHWDSASPARSERR